MSHDSQPPTRRVPGPSKAEQYRTVCRQIGEAEERVANLREMRDYMRQNMTPEERESAFGAERIYNQDTVPVTAELLEDDPAPSARFYREIMRTRR